MFVQTRCKEYHTLRVRGKIGVVYDTSPESHIEIISSHRALKMTWNMKRVCYQDFGLLIFIFFFFAMEKLLILK